jgi:hypothetical protein
VTRTEVLWLELVVGEVMVMLPVDPAFTSKQDSCAVDYAAADTGDGDRVSGGRC